MGGFDEHAAIIGDWMPPSPSPRSFFAAMLGDDSGSRSVSEPPNNNNGGFTFPGPDRQIGSENGDQEAKSGEFVEQKMGSRAGLVERMAARAGHNAPRLNTDVIRPVDILQNQQARSPYLTIPPGLSPTTLLDSPVFLSNSLVQPSPTTGKFQFASNGTNNSNGKTSMMFSDSSDKSKDSFFHDANNSSFAFNPFPESTLLSHDHPVNPLFMPGQSFQSNEALVQSENHLEEHHDDEADQRMNASSEDGYNWRKYGQKQVKGSEYPRSYYKCTYSNCPVKKKVERSHEGHITEIIYKGAHNHPKLPPNRRLGVGPASVLSDMQADNINLEVTSSTVVSDATFSNDEEEDDRVTHGSVSLGCDGEEDESESKRRKVEAYAADVSGATRAIREPRVVVQTTSEVDILDDGYRWRKYGQKVVKGNPNPRSYYKCTSTGCTVRKHVERASHDLKSVITTYEGKHNHDVPAARNSSHANSTMAAPPVHMAEPSQMQNSMARFERVPYGLPGNQHLGPGPTHGYGYPMSQQGPGGLGLAHMAMANQGKMPVHHYLAQGQMNEMGFVLPKGVPKVEPMSEPGLNLANGGAPMYQMMNRLPLGPQM